MTEKVTNGYIKWWQLVSVSMAILSVIVTLGLFGAKEVIAIDMRANQRFMDNRTIIYDLLKTNSADHELIKCQLARIETKLQMDKLNGRN